jgi:hypothetical protein
MDVFAPTGASPSVPAVKDAPAARIVTIGRASTGNPPTARYAAR